MMNDNIYMISECFQLRFIKTLIKAAVCAKNILTNWPEPHFRKKKNSIWLSNFYAIFTNQNQFILDGCIRLVIFGADWGCTDMPKWICFHVNFLVFFKILHESKN